MQTKLTLLIDSELIKKAESDAKKRGMPVSRIVADYFSVLDAEPDKETSELTPLVRSLKGSLKGARASKQDYHKYLEGKFRWKDGMDKRLTEIEDIEITRIYDKVYGNAEESAKAIELAEEMLAANAVHEEEDNW